MAPAAILQKLRLWCLLLLATVGAHAMLPTSMPEAEVRGSPFNPATIDVSTSHVRRASIVPQSPRDNDLDADDTPSLVGASSIAAPEILITRSAVASVGGKTSARCINCILAEWDGAQSRPRAPPLS